MLKISIRTLFTRSTYSISVIGCWTLCQCDCKPRLPVFKPLESIENVEDIENVENVENYVYVVGGRSRNSSNEGPASRLKSGSNEEQTRVLNKEKVNQWRDDLLKCIQQESPKEVSTKLEQGADFIHMCSDGHSNLLADVLQQVPQETEELLAVIKRIMDEDPKQALVRLPNGMYVLQYAIKKGFDTCLIYMLSCKIEIGIEGKDFTFLSSLLHYIIAEGHYELADLCIRALNKDKHSKLINNQSPYKIGENLYKVTPLSLIKHKEEEEDKNRKIKTNKWEALSRLFKAKGAIVNTKVASDKYKKVKSSTH